MADGIYLGLRPDPTIAVLVEENERLRTDNEHLRATLQTMEARRSAPIEHLPCVTDLGRST
jgi:regulator of replication initiation timing